MKQLNAEFIISAEKLSQCPDFSYPEFPLLGRSNVGKSSFINALCNNRKLAKTSNTPGKTRLINFFNFSDKFIVADLPGYLFNLLMLVMKSKKTIFKCVNGLKRTICRYLQLLPKLIIFPAERFKKFWPILGKNFPEMSFLSVLRTDFTAKVLLNICLIYVNN